MGLDLAFRDAVRCLQADPTDDAQAAHVGRLYLQQNGTEIPGELKNAEPFTLSPSVPEARMNYRIDDLAGKELIRAEIVLRLRGTAPSGEIHVARERLIEKEGAGCFALFVKIPGARVVQNPVESVESGV